MHDEDSIKAIAATLQQYDLLPVATVFSVEELHRNIADKINILVTTDFSRLISILYRLDIAEKKLKALLSHSKNTPAGDIIATMIFERQLQKMESRRAFRSTGSCDEEKW